MQLKKGEVRDVGFKFRHPHGEQFTICNADFEIVKSTGETILAGFAQVTDIMVLTSFNATEVGSYIVKFSCHVGSEVYKLQEPIKVVE